MKMLKSSNMKLDKSILTFSLPPVKSCLNCSTCKDTCYARKAYRARPTVKKSWDINFKIAKNNPKLFINSINNQLKNTKKPIVRIHMAGDFFSKEYINLWCEIALENIDKTFYGYSKVFEIFPEELEKLNSLKNVNIINSIAEDGFPNYGKSDRVEYLRNLGYHICSAVKNTRVKCGKTCKKCYREKLVAFPIH